MFFNRLTPEQREKIRSIGNFRDYPKGTHVFEEGTVGSSFALLLEGRVEVRKRLDAGGKHKKIVELGKGALIGELCFLGVECRSASVVALVDCEVIEFERRAFEDLIGVEPEIGLALYRGMAQELAQRLVSIDEQLMDAIGWALNKTATRSDEGSIEVPERPKLKLKIEPPKTLPKADSTDTSATENEVFF
jgi:CRP-like cAMP-binding protein